MHSIIKLSVADYGFLGDRVVEETLRVSSKLDDYFAVSCSSSSQHFDKKVSSFVSPCWKPVIFKGYTIQTLGLLQVTISSPQQIFFSQFFRLLSTLQSLTQKPKVEHYNHLDPKNSCPTVSKGSFQSPCPALHVALLNLISCMSETAMMACIY